MKALVVYDSKFGNTERVARAIAEALGAETRVVAAGEASAYDLAGIALLVIGGPTQGHGASPGLKAFLDHLSPDLVRGLPVVAFDTRLSGPRLLTGSAASVAAKHLVKKGAILLLSPESFLVKGTEGPLIGGEMERARAWALKVREAAGLPEREPAIASR